jgi:acyl-CoA thioesterase
MDEQAARRAFDHAIETQIPGFGTFFLAKFLGLDITYPEDRSEVRFTVQDFMFNPQGSLHGGIIGTALDIAMGHLLQHTSGAGMTLEMKTQFIRAPKAGEIMATGRFLRKGRSINFLEARLQDQAGDLLAFATSTWRLLA